MMIVITPAVGCISIIIIHHIITILFTGIFPIVMAAPISDFIMAMDIHIIMIVTAITILIGIGHTGMHLIIIITGMVILQDTIQVIILPMVIIKSIMVKLSTPEGAEWEDIKVPVL